MESYLKGNAFICHLIKTFNKLSLNLNHPKVKFKTRQQMNLNQSI